MSDYENMSLVDLRLEAKKLGIKNVTTYKKKELLEKIKEFCKNDNAAQVKKTERKKTVSKNNDNKKINKKLDNDNKDVDIKNIDNKKNDDRNEDILRENNSYKTSSQDKKVVQEPDEISQLDSGEVREGILEVMQEGYRFIGCHNHLPGDGNVYVSPALIRK